MARLYWGAYPTGDGGWAGFVECDMPSGVRLRVEHEGRNPGGALARAVMGAIDQRDADVMGMGFLATLIPDILSTVAQIAETVVSQVAEGKRPKEAKRAVMGAAPSSMRRLVDALSRIERDEAADVLGSMYYGGAPEYGYGPVYPDPYAAWGYASPNPHGGNPYAAAYGNPYGGNPYSDPYGGGYGYPGVMTPDPYAAYGYGVPSADPYAAYYDPWGTDPFAYHDPYADPYGYGDDAPSFVSVTPPTGTRAPLSPAAPRAPAPRSAPRSAPGRVTATPKGNMRLQPGHNYYGVRQPSTGPTRRDGSARPVVTVVPRS